MKQGVLITPQNDNKKNVVVPVIKKQSNGTTFNYLTMKHS